MSHRFLQIDAFTDRAFAGNPAAVFVTDAACDENWMQAVAREMNLPETAFLHPVPGVRGSMTVRGSNPLTVIDPLTFNLRWFTPTTEVELCGHATLASAHALWEEGYLDRAAEARFETRSGGLSARLDEDWIWLDFPATPATPADELPALTAALGAEPLYLGRTSFDYLVELESTAAVTGLAPDLEALKRLPVRGVIVTAASTDFDFVSRYFAPAYGIPEDPVTGSAHCALGPYWHGKTGRSEFTAYQASRRGGMVRVRTIGTRVALGGQAVTTVKGELLA